MMELESLQLPKILARPFPHQPIQPEPDIPLPDGLVMKL